MRRVALVCVGLILLFAAVAKVAALGGPVDSLGWPPLLIVLGAATEVLLGLWLLYGVAMRAAHLAAIGLFVLFAALSTYQVAVGVPSRGCLGKLYVHPAWMLGFDLFVLAALGGLWFVERRRSLPIVDEGPSRSDRPAAPSPRFVLLGGAIGAAGLLSLAYVAWAFAGSWDSAVGVSSGETLVISPAVVDLGPATVGETKTATVRVVNASSEAVRIVGGKTSCGCMTTRDLPAVIPGFGSAEFPIDVEVQAVGIREEAVTLHSDHASRPTLSARIRVDGRPAAD